MARTQKYNVGIARALESFAAARARKTGNRQTEDANLRGPVSTGTRSVQQSDQETPQEQRVCNIDPGDTPPGYSRGRF